MEKSLNDINEELKNKKKNMLNFEEDADLDKPVYRVFSIERLEELFKEKKNTLVQPSMWNDPFENLVFQQALTMDNGYTVALENLRKDLFAQCWTLNTREIDTLWRLYAPLNNGIRVKTTLKKLFDSFYNPEIQFSSVLFYMGKVVYHSHEQIKAYFGNPENMELLFDNLAGKRETSLLIKPKVCHYENELRIIYKGHPDEDKSNVYQYPLDPCNVFDELLFDPRMDDELFLHKKIEFMKCGFSKTIRKSKLYHVGNFRKAAK